MRHATITFENRVMDVLHDYPQTASDVADRLEHHVKRVQECLRKLAERGLVEQRGNVKRNGLWQLARTKRR